jgi:lipoyl(octanoyl) transferase
MNSSISLKDLGLLGYEKTLNIQLEHFELIKNIKLANRNSEQPQATPNFFFFVTHPHVYTMGKNGNISNILYDQSALESRHIEFFQTNRGGDSTYHGPGQIVGYPILDLDHFSADIHLYMRNLEEVIIRTLAEYGITGHRSEGETGVWLDIHTIPSPKDLCHGCSHFAMGYHAWLCTQCQYRFELFSRNYSLWYQRQRGYFDGA